MSVTLCSNHVVLRSWLVEQFERHGSVQLYGRALPDDLVVKVTVLDELASPDQLARPDNGCVVVAVDAAALAQEERNQLVQRLVAHHARGRALCFAPEALTLASEISECMGVPPSTVTIVPALEAVSDMALLQITSSGPRRVVALDGAVVVQLDSVHNTLSVYGSGSVLVASFASAVAGDPITAAVDVLTDGMSVPW